MKASKFLYSLLFLLSLSLTMCESNKISSQSESEQKNFYVPLVADINLMGETPWQIVPLEDNVLNIKTTYFLNVEFEDCPSDHIIDYSHLSFEYDEDFAKIVAFERKIDGNSVYSYSFTPIKVTGEEEKKVTLKYDENTLSELSYKAKDFSIYAYDYAPYYKGDDNMETFRLITSVEEFNNTIPPYHFRNDTPTDEFFTRNYYLYVRTNDVGMAEFSSCFIKNDTLYVALDIVGIPGYYPDMVFWYNQDVSQFILKIPVIEVSNMQIWFNKISKDPS